MRSAACGLKAGNSLAHLHLLSNMRVDATFTSCAVAAVQHSGVDVMCQSSSFIYLFINALTGTLKPQSNGPLYSFTVIGTLALSGWAVTFGTARRGLGGLWPRPGHSSSSLYEMLQPTHQRSVYQLHIIRCGTAITFAL